MSIFIFAPFTLCKPCYRRFETADSIKLRYFTHILTDADLRQPAEVSKYENGIKNDKLINQCLDV